MVIVLFIIAILIILLNISIFVIQFRNIKKNIDEITENEEVDIESEIKGQIEDTTVKEIMTPRTSIYAIDSEQSLEENLNEIIEQGFSRIPVFKENIDNILGVLYIKDILKADVNKKVSEYIRKATYVPETMSINKMLDEFRTKQTHMAIIIDEYGGTSGIVTIEDILEEIVGEIRDEYDTEIDSIIKVSDNIYDIQGDTLVEEINEELEIDIPISEEYDTISGYMQDILGKVAQENDKVKTNNYIIKVMEVDNKRIVKLRIILPELEKGEENE